MTDGRWLLELRGCAIPLEDHELDRLAESTAFRLEPETFVELTSGVGIRMKSSNDTDVLVHLCFSDEVEQAVEALAMFLPPGRHALVEDEQK